MLLDLPKSITFAWSCSNPHTMLNPFTANVSVFANYACMVLNKAVNIMLFMIIGIRTHN